MSGHEQRLDRLIDETGITVRDVLEYDQDDEVVAKVVAAEEWRHELMEELKNPTLLNGAKLPWGITHENLRFRPGETTVWGGH